MTVTFAVDSNNDLYLGTGDNIAVHNDLPAIIQNCETATRAQLGEMVLENQLGIPNFETVWNGSPDYNLYTSYLRTTLMNVQGVQEVVSLDISINGNVLSYRATIKTSFGTADING